MTLAASCPRCRGVLRADQGSWTCPDHGWVDPLLRPEVSDYDGFAQVVGLSGDLPIYLPWPMSPGWSIADVGCVHGPAGATATTTTTVGVSDLDGPVEVTVIAEEPGVGLGARCAGTGLLDPGDQIGQGPPAIHVRPEGRSVPMWAVDPVADDALLATSVFAGSAEGRWLWLVVRPASAALLLRDAWLFADVSGFGPEALEMPFGGSRPTW